MNSWNVPGQSDARGAIRNLAKTNIIFVLATRFRGGARVPARLVFRHVFIATFDAPIPTCGVQTLQIWCESFDTKRNLTKVGTCTPTTQNLIASSDTSEFLQKE